MLQLVLRLVFVFGANGAGTGAVGGTVAVVLQETEETREHFHSLKKNPPGKNFALRKVGALFRVSLLKRRGKDNTHYELRQELNPHLLFPDIPHPAHKRQIETDPETVLEEEGGSAAVQLPFGDDGDAVAQQVGLVHVMSGQNHRPACKKSPTFIQVLSPTSESKEHF